MQSNPKRERVINMGCARCSNQSVVIAEGEERKKYKRVPAGHSIPRHGRAKPRGQHAYRRGLVSR